MEPLIDAMVHAQDICVPLGDRPADARIDAAVAAAERVWQMGFPFHARRRLSGTRLVATDADFAVGEGQRSPPRSASSSWLLTGRQAAVAAAGVAQPAAGSLRSAATM